MSVAKKSSAERESVAPDVARDVIARVAQGKKGKRRAVKSKKTKKE